MSNRLLGDSPGRLLSIIVILVSMSSLPLTYFVVQPFLHKIGIL